MIPGRATAEGTARFRQRFAGRLAGGHFRRLGELWLSSIGLGTYLGEADAAADGGYEGAILEALDGGCNVFDTAINYRHQRSERALGRALARAVSQGLARRDEVFVATKGGFLPFDGEMPPDPSSYLRKVFLESGLLEPGEVAAGCHAMSPGFLADQLARSLGNLGLEAVDLYYLHNPETQLEEVSREVFSGRLEEALGWLEEEARGGRIDTYGLATWTGLRHPPGSPEHLPLSEIARLAARSGGGRSGLRAVQLPFNLAMPEALATPTQELDGATVPLLVAAQKLGIGVFTSASILQGRLAGGLPAEVSGAFPGLASDALRALQFARSAPGVTAALVGMGRPEHARENLALAGIPPAGAEAYRQLFG